MQLDFSDDALSWDQVESVSYEAARLAPFPLPGAAVPNANAPDFVPWVKRRALTQRELAASGGVYTGRDVVWLLPSKFLSPTRVPKPGDVVVDKDQQRWTALEVGLNKWRNTWRLMCRNLSVALDLNDVVNIERADITYDASGVPVKAFPTGLPPLGGRTLYAGLRARVQPVTDEIKDQRGIRGFESQFDVTVERDVDVTNEDRVWWPARGIYLDIRTVQRSRRIDELPYLETVHKP